MVCSLFRLRRGVWQTSTIAALAFLVVGCSEGKVSQCNQLIGVANQAVTQVQSVTQSANPAPGAPGTSNANNANNIEAMTRIATAADQARTEMEGLQFSDERLTQFQSRFVAMYTEIGNATRALVSSAQASNSQGAQQAFDQLKTATEKEAPLVTEVNQYCANPQ
ncbi:hypothetical protein [Leptolyngbya ohadii]|uniref:hypothetical protein n=1 Tax=Leptolyngbya ohadii TaxID=1962290 RepID=UPI000B59E521|nr:hypothetical protein [Leptolyngbya ohadii]